MSSPSTVIKLTSADDTYTAAAGDYLINGLGGNDTITTGAGNSTLNLGDGNATITTGAGNSIVNVGNGNSTITTGAGNSLVSVGDGNATITTGAGDSTVMAGKGNNTITTGAGNNTVHTLAGDQTVTTGAGNDEIDVGVGSSTVVSAAGNDVLVYHAAGNQNTSSTFDGGTGIDTLRLALTRAEWMSDAVQADVANYLTFLSAHTGASGEASAAAFKFNTFGLTASSFEKLQVTVDGVLMDPANHAVTLDNDVISTTENEASIAVDVLGNDSVPDLIKTFTYTNPINGSVHLDAAYSDTASPAAAQFIYTPTAGFYDHLAVGETATDAFTYTVTDATGDVKTATVNVTIMGTNDAPVITSATQAGAVSEGNGRPLSAMSASGTVSYSDVDLTDTHTLSISTTAAHGNASVDALGNWSYTVVDAGAVNALAAGEHLADSFTVMVDDGHGGQALQSVHIDITGTNDAPVIGMQDVMGAVTAVAQSVAPPAGPLLLTVQQYLGFHANNLATLQSYAASHAANYTVQTNVIDYTDDTAGFAGDIPGSVRWPAAVAQNVYNTSGINDNFFARITANFSVTTADTYTFRTYNDDGVFLLIDNKLVISDTSYHPETPFTGSIALAPGNHSIELFFFEGGGEASLELSVRSSTGPYGLLGTTGGGLGGVVNLVSDSGTISFSDVDLSDTHSLSAVTPMTGALGTLTARMSTDTSHTTGLGGAITWNYSASNAALGYLAAGQTKIETFSFNLLDGKGGSVLNTVNVTITGTNEAPVITSAAQTGAVKEDATLTATGTVTSSDIDNGAQATYSGNTVGVHGSFAVNANTGVWTYTLNNAANQNLAQDESKSETFTVTVTDDQGATATQKVVLSITGTNDAPIITSTAQAGTVKEDTTLIATGTVASSDVDHGATAVYSGNTVGVYGSFAVNASTGVWTYTLDNAGHQNLAQGETHNETVTVTVTDDKGATATQAVNMTITGTNDAPVITSLAQSGTVTSSGSSLESSAPATGQVSYSDIDLTDKHTLTIGTAAAHGITSVDSLGNWSYTTSNDSAVSALMTGEHLADSFTVLVDDLHGGQVSQLVSIDIVGGTKYVPVANHAPVAVDDSSFVAAGGSVTLNVLANDSDVDGDVITVKSVGSAAHGTVELNSSGLVTYKPAAGYSGSDSFHYTIQDVHGASAVGEVSLIVGVANHQKVGADVFLQGNYMEIGVSSAGSLGTASAAPAGYHPTGGRANISFLVDQDGWNTGAAPTSGDFTLPGSPVDVMAVAYNNLAFANDQRSGHVQIATTTTDTSASGTLSATTVGTANSALKVVQVVELDPQATYYTTTVTLTNTTASAMSNVRFMRSFDPDQDLDKSGTFNTFNDVLANPNVSGSIAAATAVGVVSKVGVVLVSFDASARASNFGFANYDPNVSAAYAAPQDANGASMDAAISLTFNVNTLAAGASITRSFNTTMNLSSNANDMLIAGPGHHNLVGGNGDDYLIGVVGDDTMSGGTGDNKFVFTAAGGNDTIIDFTAGAGTRDEIFLDGVAGISNFTQVLAATTQVGANAVIHLSTNDSITLIGVNVSQLAASDFLFA